MPPVCAAIILTLCVPDGWSTPEHHGGGPGSFGSGAYLSSPDAKLSILTSSDVPVALDSRDNRSCSKGKCVLYRKRCSSKFACEYDVEGPNKGYSGYGFTLEARNPASFRRSEKRLAIILDSSNGITIPLSDLNKYEKYELEEWQKPVPQ